MHISAQLNSPYSCKNLELLKHKTQHIKPGRTKLKHEKLAKSTTARSHPSLSLILGIRKIEVLIAVLLTHYLTGFKNLHKNRF